MPPFVKKKSVPAPLSPARVYSAVGAYIFAGGFTLGVKRAGFDVQCHLEESDYGVATARKNFPGLPIHYPPDRWPLDEISQSPVDWVYGNPPCLAGYTNVLTESGWRTIASLAEENFSGNVATVTSDGKIEYRRVLKHHVNPYSGQMMRVRFVHGGGAVRGLKRAVVTQEHKFMTRRGWVAAMDLRDDDLVATGETAPDATQAAANDGMLLGDAKVSEQPQFCTSQTAHQLVAAKSLLLSSLGTKTVFTAKSSSDGYERKSQTYLWAKTGVWVRQQRQRWYPDGVKVVPRDLVLEDVTLAMWFMDDGCGRALTWSGREEYQSRRHGPWVSLATHGFADDDIAFLVDKLADRGMTGEAVRRKSGYVDLEIRGESAVKFFDLVSPWVTPDMRYKLPPDSQEYDATLYQVRAETTGWDHVVVEKDYVSKWGKVFCIDVEETHNFVTLGGVVHNCAAWSQAGKVVFGANWRDDARVDCTRRHFGLLERLRPRVWCWESVPRAFEVGRELVDELTVRALDLGYSVTYLLHDGQYLGMAQRRPRFFFVAHRVAFVPRPHDYSHTTSCGEVLSKMSDCGPVDMVLSPEIEAIIPRLRQGRSLRDLWEELNPEPELNERGQVRGRPPFTYHRIREDRPSNTIAGFYLVHPTEDRCLTTTEMAVLCGFPRDFEFVGSGKCNQIARGVCPPVGEWLALSVRDALDRDEPENGVVRLMDFRKPPGRVEVLPRPDVTPTLVKSETTEPETVAVARPLTPRLGSNGSGAYIRQLLGEGKSTEEVLRLNLEKFPGSRATAADVSWNKRRMAVTAQTASVGTVQSATTRATAPARVVAASAADVPQPTRSKRAIPPRRFDTTALTESSHGYRVHRDYAAHFFRWGWASRAIDNTMRVLDVGCGADFPFVKVLVGAYAHGVPREYVGVDMNPLTRPPSRPWATFHGEFDFTSRYIELGTFDVIINFEVIEHMGTTDGLGLLRGMRECLSPGGRIFLSTPVFDGKAAANHIHEYTILELAAAVDEAGLVVERRYGTFANYREIKKVCTPEQLEWLDGLNKFYSTDVTACFLAPLYPDASRNNVWVLRRDDEEVDQ